MIGIGDLVEVGFKGDSGKMVAEVVNTNGRNYEVFVIHATEKLQSFENRQINVVIDPAFDKNRITKIELDEDNEYRSAKLYRLIDLALQMKDEQWFMELTNRLNSHK